jgi:uncharacterized protein YneF (UPF0154 family)
MDTLLYILVLGVVLAGFFVLLGFYICGRG